MTKPYLVFERSASKYGNKKTEYKGEVYDSKREAAYAAELDMLKKASSARERVVSWKRQVPFSVKINGVHICKYISDFVVQYADGREEIIDVKGKLTDVYKLKKKMVEAYHNVKIIEVF